MCPRVSPTRQAGIKAGPPIIKEGQSDWRRNLSRKQTSLKKPWEFNSLPFRLTQDRYQELHSFSGCVQSQSIHGECNVTVRVVSCELAGTGSIPVIHTSLHSSIGRALGPYPRGCRIITCWWHLCRDMILYH